MQASAGAAQGRQREDQADPPQKKTRGEGGGGRRTAHSRHTARQHHKTRPNPPPRRHRRQDPQRGTEGPPSQNWHNQARNSGPPEKGTPKMHRHTPHKIIKKEPGTHPEREGTGGQGPQGPGQGQPATEKEKKNTPRLADQEGRGTAETRAQHPRPHSTPRPGKAGNKQGAPTNTHPRTVPPTRGCRRPRGTGARAHTHPNSPRGEVGRSRNPNPSTHACTAHRKRWGAGGARTQPHTSHMQAET